MVGESRQEAEIATGISRMAIKQRPKFSGAARRKYKLARAGEAEAVATEAGTSTTTVEDASTKAVKEPKGAESAPGSSQRGKKAPTPAEKREGYGKRQRESKETPPNDRPKRPRAAGHGQSSYAMAASNLSKLAVVHKELREDITEEQSTLIQEGLMETMDGISAGDFTPRFQQTYLSKGVLRVICADQQSATWLREQVKNLRKWEGADLEVIEASDLPKYVRVMAWISGASMDTATALKRLEQQNPGLATGRWITYERHEDASGKGVRLVLGVVDRAIPVLQATGMKPYLRMGRAKSRLLDAHYKAGEGQMDVGENAAQDGQGHASSSEG